MSTRHTGSRFARQLRKYSASNYEGRLETLSNRLDSTRIERLVTVDVDLSYWKSISKTTLLITSRVDPCDSSRFVYIEYPNLMLKYVLSSFANRLPVRRIYFTNDESCPPVRIVSIRQNLMPLFNALGKKKAH